MYSSINTRSSSVTGMFTDFTRQHSASLYFPLFSSRSYTSLSVGISVIMSTTMIFVLQVLFLETKPFLLRYLIIILGLNQHYHKVHQQTPKHYDFKKSYTMEIIYGSFLIVSIINYFTSKCENKNLIVA